MEPISEIFSLRKRVRELEERVEQIERASVPLDRALASVREHEFCPIPTACREAILGNICTLTNVVTTSACTARLKEK